MCDMFDSARYIFRTWKNGSEWQERWLGPFDESMNAERAARILENEKLCEKAQEEWARGWEAARDEHFKDSPK